jgi:hypothetical protein
VNSNVPSQYTHQWPLYRQYNGIPSKSGRHFGLVAATATVTTAAPDFVSKASINDRTLLDVTGETDWLLGESFTPASSRPCDHEFAAKSQIFRFVWNNRAGHRDSAGVLVTSLQCVQSRRMSSRPSIGPVESVITRRFTRRDWLRQ